VTNCNGKAPGIDGERKRKNINELAMFIKRYQPNAVAIATTDLGAAKVYDDVKKLV